MENLFDRFFGDDAGYGSAVKTWSPRIDVEETEKEMLVKCDLPGVDPKDVEVTVANGSLTVRGEKKEEKEEKKKNYHRVERFVGQFYREIPLPTGCDGSKVSATSSKGVITVSIPKSPECQPKKIAVKAQD
jgi:HSP20 family protein